MKQQARNTHPRRESGFTLVEIMIAGSLSMVLILVLSELIMQAQHMADVMIMQSTLNSQAREVFELLMDGGKSGSTSIMGYHGSSRDPFKGKEVDSDAAAAGSFDSVNIFTRTNNTWNAVSFRIRLGMVAGNIIIKTQETFPVVTITCATDNDRVKTCKTGETHKIDGYIDELNVDNTTRSINSRTPEVTFTVIDPQHVPRDGVTSSRFIQSEYSSSFWTVFTMMSGS